MRFLITPSQGYITSIQIPIGRAHRKHIYPFQGRLADRKRFHYLNSCNPFCFYTFSNPYTSTTFTIFYKNIFPQFFTFAPKPELHE
jgi:hypothetical protein